MGVSFVRSGTLSPIPAKVRFFILEDFMQKVVFGFYQEPMVKLNIDLMDILIVDWFVLSIDNKENESVIVDGIEYTRVSYKQLLSDIPILNINKVTLGRRLKKLTENGILNNYKKIENGVFMYYSLGENYKLISTRRW
jgi:hypothetical protein